MLQIYINSYNSTDAGKNNEFDSEDLIRYEKLKG